MKKAIAVLVSMLLIAVLSACNSEPVADNSAPSGTTTTDNNYRVYQELTSSQATFVVDSNLMRVSIPQVNLKNVFIIEATSDELLDKDMYGQVYLLGDDRYGGARSTSDHYLAIVSNDKIIVQDLSKWKDQACYSGNIELCDFDGDGDNEILLHECIGMTGGAGQYLSRVFNFVDGKIVEMFSSCDGTTNFDTGFSITILKNKKFGIENEITKYSEEFILQDRSEEYFNFWYDENGNPFANEILVDSFCEFSPVDTDGDGVYEISCRQYVSLIGHSDGIGTAKTVLKYDGISSTFKIVKAEFVL